MKTSSSFPKAIDAQGLEVDYSEVPQRFCEAFVKGKELSSYPQAHTCESSALRRHRSACSAAHIC